MNVTLHHPSITGDTVTFRWEQDLPNPFQVDNSFYFRYEGLDLNRFSIELFYEIFLALQLRVFGGYDEPVTLHFPSPVPANSAAYWLTAHNATAVTITPIAETGSYDPWTESPYLVEDPKKAAVFFGGGKDSTLAACLLSEIYGQDEIVLIQFVGPLQNSAKHLKFLEERQERLMLTPAREHLGVATQRCWTNYQAIFKRTGYPLRPHLELYTVGSLPALLFWGNELCTFTANWTLMSTDIQQDGTPKYRYGPSRPTALAAQSKHYAVTFGAKVTVANIIMPFHALTAHMLLAARYPDQLDHIVSCTLAEPDKRWCYRCDKCALFAISCLSTRHSTADFDIDYFLRESRFIKRIIAYAETGVTHTSLGNAPFERQSFFIGARSFIPGCHAVARIDPDNLPVALSQEAMANLALLQALFGNQLFPDFEKIPRITLDLLPIEVRQTITEMTAEHFEIIDRISQPMMVGDSPTSYQLDEPKTLRVLALEHMREH